MKKTACFLAAMLLLQTMPIPSLAIEEEGTLQWPAYQAYGPEQNHDEEREMLFRPLDNYSCEQNPPDFSWRKVKQAESYDLIICRDEALTDIVRERRELEGSVSVYNFDEPFAPGIYYWSVRYRSGGAYSVWQPARRFLIEDDASLFPVPDISDALEKAEALGHPRYFTTKKNLKAFREAAQTGEMQQRLQTAIESSKAEIPTLDTSITYAAGAVGGRNGIWQETQIGYNRLDDISFAYVATGDKSIGVKGVNILSQLAEFQLPPWNSNTDSQLALHAMYLAIYYDSLYELMTSEQRAKVLEKISQVLQSSHSTYMEENDVLHKNPRASHEWRMAEMMVSTCLLTLGEVPIAEEMGDYMLPLLINLYSPHQVEDGGFRGGTGYWRVHNAVPGAEFLRRSGIVNLFDKAYFKNSLYFPLYMLPAGAPSGAFGDDGVAGPDFYVASHYNYQLNRQKSPTAKWGLEQLAQLGISPLKRIEGFDYSSFPDMEAEAPLLLANSRYFRDSGYAALHSSLIDRDRVSLYFHSGWWGGTYGHQHADQNGFILNAYGEKLAIQSGFYPWYGSPHHKNYATKTYSINTITYNGGKGQPTGDGTAQGLITGFLTHQDFDYLAGDATKAYKEARGGTIPPALSKAKRHILYLRPDMFIFVDDLAAKQGETASFEFWLNSEDGSNLEIYENRKGARITKGEAVLDASVHYPASADARYLSGFCGPDLIQYPKEIDGVVGTTPDPKQPEQQRVYFATKPANQTKIVTTLDVHKKDESIQNMKSETFEKYVKLSFEDGTIVYVNLTDGETITADNITFNGVAVMKNEDSMMLAEGTELTIDGQKRIGSSVPISVVAGKDELSLSDMDEDAELEVYYPGLSAVTEVKSEKVRVIEEGKPRNGVTWNTEGDYVKFSLYNGAHHFYLNGRPLPGSSAGESMLRLSVDGEEKEIPARNRYDHEGKIVGEVTIKDLNGIYRIEEKDGIAMNDIEQLVSFSGSQTFSTTSLSPSVKLRKMEMTQVELIDDFDKVKEDSAVYVDAENYLTLQAVSAVEKITIDRYKFLSGGTILQNLCQLGDIATYRFEVPYDGEFDLVLNNVVYNTEQDSNMCMTVGDQTALFTMPVTNGPNGPNVQKGANIWGIFPVDWHVCRVKTKMKLNKGTYTVKLMGMGGGLNKFDWIGLIDSAK